MSRKISGHAYGVPAHQLTIYHIEPSAPDETHEFELVIAHGTASQRIRLPLADAIDLNHELAKLIASA